MSEALETVEEELELTEEEQLAQYEAEYNKAYFGDDEVADEPEEEPEVAEEEHSEEVAEETEQPNEQVSNFHTLKWNGKEVNVTEEERNAMAQQGFDYTYKAQQLAKERKALQAERDLLERIRKGDKQALAELSKTSGIDPLDLVDIEVNDEQGRSQPAEPFIAPEVSTMMEELSHDKALYNKMAEFERHLPSNVVATMARDPRTFYTVVSEVRSGDADIVLPRMQAQMAGLHPVDRAALEADPQQFANFYANVKQSMINELTKQQQAQQKPKETVKQKPNHNEVAVRRSGNSARVQEESSGELLSEDAYQKILERLERQA